MKNSEITDKIINSFYKVYNVLGYGFLEKVHYENQVVGDYYADIIVNDLIILEIKAAEGLRDENKEISEVETSNPCESAQSASSAFYSSG